MSRPPGNESSEQGVVQRLRRYLYRDVISSFSEELDRLALDARRDTREQIQKLFDIAVAHAEDRVRITIDLLARPFREEQQKALEEFSDALIKQRSEQLEANAQAITRRHETRLQTVHEEIERETAAATEKARLACHAEATAASRAAAEAAALVTRTLENGSDKLKEFNQQFESSFAAALEQQRARLDESLSQGFGEFQRSKEFFLRGLRDGTESTLQTSIEKATNDFANRANQRAQELIESWIDRYRREAQDVNLKSKTDLEALAKAADQQTAVGRETFANALKESAAAAIETFREALGRSLHEHAEAAAQELGTKLGEVERQHSTALQQQLEKQAGELVERSAAEAKAKLDVVGQQIYEAAYRHVGVATVALKDLTEQARKDAAAVLNETLSTLRAQVQDVVQADVRKLQEEARSTVEAIRERLRQATQAL
jgi:hypothetical protein